MDIVNTPVERRRCGRSRLELSVLGLGCWSFGGGEYWGPQSQDDVNRTVRRAVELGINYFDTAEAYNAGRSEESLGLAIRGLPRDRLVLGTKISPSNMMPAVLVDHCEASLRRLGVETIDLYLVHWPITRHAAAHFAPDPIVPPVAEAFATLAGLRSQGKIGHIGVSNFGRAYLEEARATGVEIVANELPYNLLCRAVERELLPCCAQAGVGVIGYMTLLQGLLAADVPRLDGLPVWRSRTRHFSPQRAGPLCRHGEPGAEAETVQALGDIVRISRTCGVSLREIAIQWALAGHGITSVLVGARNQQQLEANVRAAGEPLEPTIVAQLNAATDALKNALGSSFDYYEHTARDRTGPIY
jgi:aryl-alcohol dehydrogenase-like predicted oxidoreductase